MNREEEPALLRGPGRFLAQRATRYWWVLLIVGVAWLVIGWVVLRADVTSLATVGVLLGVVFIASGVNEAALAGMVTGGWKVLHYGIAFLFLLAGLWAFIRPINTFFALASVLGLILVFAEAFEISRGVASRGGDALLVDRPAGRSAPAPAGRVGLRLRPAGQRRPAHLPDPVLGRLHGAAAGL